MPNVGPRNHVFGGAQMPYRVTDNLGVPRDAAFRQNSLTTCYIIITTTAGRWWDC